MLNNRRSSRPSSFETNNDVESVSLQDEKQVKIAAQHARQEKSIFIKVVLLLGTLNVILLLCYCLTPWSSSNKEFAHPRLLLQAGESIRNTFFFRQKDRVHPRVFQLLENSLGRQELHVDHRVTFFIEEDDLKNDPNQAVFRPILIPRKVEPMISRKRQEMLDGSNDYRTRARDVLETEHCKAQYSWQMDSKPTCNTVHEVGMRLDSSFPLLSLGGSVDLVNNGYWRDVWIMEAITRSSNNSQPEQVETVVLKTQRAEHEFSIRNMDRNRRDAMAMEHLTKSPWILDIYGFCGSSSISEYASNGSIHDAVFEDDEQLSVHGGDNITIPTEYLRYAIQATVGLSAVHNVDKEGRASIVHADITPSQFVMVKNGRVKLNDFNRARFLPWDAETKTVCSFRVGKNPGRNRSPEEYAYKPETEKIDVYSLGNIFYMLLTRLWPFDDIHDEKNVANMVKQGKRPVLRREIVKSTDPRVLTLLEAMRMCHEQDPKKRASARQVEQFLKKKIDSLLPGMLREWGIHDSDDPT